MKQAKITHTLAEYPLPDTMTYECQVLADVVSSAGGLMLSAKHMLTPQMFPSEIYREAWRSITEIQSKGQTVDFTTFQASVGPDIYQAVVGMISTATQSQNVFADHVETLTSQVVKFHSYQAAMKMLFDATQDPHITKEALLQNAAGYVADVQSTAPQADQGQSLAQVLNECIYQMAEDAANEKNGINDRVPTGFDSIDTILHGGFAKDQLVILAARPGVGKSAIMRHMAEHAAASGKHVIVFNLEMANREQGFRTMQAHGMTNADIYRAHDTDKAEQLTGPISGIPFHMYDRLFNLDSICTTIATRHAAGKADVAFIDYLGLLQDLDTLHGGAPLRERIGAATRRFKQLAKQCGIPIVLLCQMNRNADNEGREPRLTDLRDSGNIEQDADIVLMIDRTQTDESTEETRLYIRKHRAGRNNCYIVLEHNDTYSWFSTDGHIY